MKLCFWLHPSRISYAKYGVITFFTPIFPAKQKEIRAEEEKEAFPTSICPSNTGRWTLIFGFPEHKPFLPAFGVVQTSVRKHFSFGNAAEVI
jgi:hypothetical protein